MGRTATPGYKNPLNRPSTLDDETPDTWDSREVIYTVPDGEIEGWTIENITTETDLKRHARRQKCCVGTFQPRIDRGEYHVLSLRDLKGVAQATILLGGASHIDSAGKPPNYGYVSYGNCRDVGVKTTFKFNDQEWYLLQLRIGPNGVAPDSWVQAVKAWVEANLA